MWPSAEDAALALSLAVDRLEEAYADPKVAPFDRARIREKVIRENARFKDHLAKPPSAVIRPWTPWEPRESIIAHHPGCAT